MIPEGSDKVVIDVCSTKDHLVHSVKDFRKESAGCTYGDCEDYDVTA